MIDVFADAGRIQDSLKEAAELERKLAEQKARLEEVGRIYDSAWEEELVKGLAAAEISWCSYCGAVGPAWSLIDVFVTHWHSDNYSDPFFRDLDYHRVCSACAEKSSLSPLSEEAAYVEEHGRPMFTKDHRRERLPRNQPTIDELRSRLNLPPRFRELKQGQALAPRPLDGESNRARPSSLAG